MNTVQNLNFVDPASVVARLDIHAGASVADFGCGAGYFSFEFARRVGAEGIVHALDVLPSALEAVTSHARTLGLNNVVTKRVNLENEQGSGLGSGSMDWVVLKDILLQNKQKEVILHEVVRVLKPAGRALVVEWNPDEALVGPDKGLRVKKEDLLKLFAQVGLSVEQEIAVGGFHYAFIVKK